MVNLVLKFVDAARASGLRVSSSEVLDCLKQLELIDILDERQFGAVLRANFAKSRREQGQFERLYQLFFHELRQDERVARSEPLGDQFQTAIGSLNDQAAQSNASQAVMDFLGGDPSAMLEQIRRGLAAATAVGDEKIGIVYGLAFDPNTDTLYGAEVNDQLLTINT